MASSFDKDFGYLLPFMDRVAQAASGLSPSARTELERLLQGEKQKWERIRALLGGAGGSVSPEPAQTVTASPRPEQRGSGLTVGSLRGSR